MDNIKIIEGDITRAKVDAIVNAANPQMLGGGGVDGAIHQAAGLKLLEACRKVKPVHGVRCPVGDARITSAGNLASNYVIHTVGPRFNIDRNPEVLLASAYRNSLDLAVANNIHSIAFPAISCGVYGYPLLEAAFVALGVCVKSEYKHLAIYFYLYGEKTMEAWLQAYEKISTSVKNGKPGMRSSDNKSSC